jgi:O-antigen ligase
MIILSWLVSSLVVVWVGVTQANGGIDELREYFTQHREWSQNHPELWEKLQSNRIFSTFVYPNALGGYVIMAIFMIGLLPLLSNDRSVRWLLGFISLVMGTGLLYCLWKSQSKGSYATLCIVACVAIFLSIKRTKPRLVALGVCVLIFLSGFALGYGKTAYDKGKSSGSARLGYWEAALLIGIQHPILGTGPGTFSRVYPQYQKEGDESTKLVHNNYLQMGSDSGILGFMTFAIWMFLPLWQWFRRCNGQPATQNSLTILLGCSFLTFALHSLIDFDLYLISNSWPAFFVLGIISQASSTPTPSNS